MTSRAHDEAEHGDRFSRLARFLEQLRDASIHFTARTARREAVMIEISVPGERWEVEFLEDGSVEVERFVTTGGIQDERALADLFARFSE
jgi:hypothetical protein